MRMEGDSGMNQILRGCHFPIHVAESRFMRNAQEQTVFVIDDDAAVRDSIQELVESVGLQAEGYASAFAFLDAFQPQYSGCLVLDVRMATMSGLALQERLNELGFKIPVIVPPATVMSQWRSRR